MSWLHPPLQRDRTSWRSEGCSCPLWLCLLFPSLCPPNKSFADFVLCWVSAWWKIPTHNNPFWHLLRTLQLFSALPASAYQGFLLISSYSLCFPTPASLYVPSYSTHLSFFFRFVTADSLLYPEWLTLWLTHSKYSVSMYWNSCFWERLKIIALECGSFLTMEMQASSYCSWHLVAGQKTSLRPKGVSLAG